MAKRGPKPASKPLKVLRGTPEARIGADAPHADGVPEPPLWLDEVARSEWSRLVPELADAGLLTRADATSLALYCSAFSRRHAAMAEVLQLGMMVETGMGGWKANPAVAMVAQAEALMAKLLMEFGATPASRSRVQAGGEDEKVKEVDAFAAFLNSRKKA